MSDLGEALTWLYARTRAGEERTDQRARALLTQLGHPERAFDAVQVIGTNGKGSVCMMLARGLEVAHDRVGRFISPHLYEYVERIAVNDVLISEHEVLEFIRWAQLHSADTAFFDLTFGLACLHFKNRDVSIAVIEAGVGGALDATNALERVQATIITNVDLDHESTLGIGPRATVLENIALDKAGAIRKGVPVITAARGAALEIIREVALERGAPLHVRDSSALFGLPIAPTMRGAHQLENAQLVAATLRLLGYNEHTVETALTARHAGRLERLTKGKLEVWLDGAHNPAGARALAAALEGQRLTLLFGAMQRKRVSELLEPLLPLASSLHFVSPGLQGANPEALANQFGGTAHASLEASLEVVLERSPVLIAGSLYLVGAARVDLLRRGFAQDEHSGQHSLKGSDAL
jgi:dihydrofolate synthase / folylpolyglutamate synthase